MTDKKNIFVIVCDQLSWRALPAYGNTWVKTPNIDRIMNNGVRFSKAYTTCPLCQPARASFWSGRYPHQTKILSNGQLHHVPDFPKDMQTLGTLFNKAGYETLHFGKKHDAGSLKGFKCADLNCPTISATSNNYKFYKDSQLDDYSTKKCINYLENKTSNIPFLTIADISNPHDICNWIGDYKRDGELKEKDLPPLPDNFSVNDMQTRPIPIQYICCAHNRQAEAAKWTEKDYRHYLGAYYHYLEDADKNIGLLLDTLEKRDDFKDTLIVFFADHGDSMTSRGMVTKHCSLYEETTRIPFAFSGYNVKGKNRLIKTPLVSILDLVPTLCDFANIDNGSGMEGKSLLPFLLNENKDDDHHDYVVSEWHTEWGSTIEPSRMVRTQNFKYNFYLEGKSEELYDLINDKGEKFNLISNPKYSKILDEHRLILKKYLEKTNDPFFSLTWHADKKYRNHTPGFSNHKGYAAPVLEEVWGSKSKN